MFSSWIDIDEPTWPQRLFVIGCFLVSGFCAGALVALLPGVRLHFHNMWQAGFCGALAALPISSGLVHASRKSSHLRVIGLSLLVSLLGYLVFAIYLPILAALTSSPDSDSLASWPMAAYIGFLMPVATWRVYLPSAVTAGLLIAVAVRRCWPLTSAEAEAIREGDPIDRVMGRAYPSRYRGRHEHGHGKARS